MPKDPLSLFAHEKVAGDGAPGMPVDEFHRISARPSSQSIDPGERALAGMAAVSGSLSAKFIPILAESAIVSRITRGEAGMPRPGGLGPASSVKELLTKQFSDPSSKFLGLFDVTGRAQSKAQWLSPGMEAERLKVGHRLQEIEDIADSFIDKHNLKEKGVKIHLRQGPLSGTLTGQYVPSTKQVFIPSVGKATLLHELGHAADYTTRLGRIRKFVEPAIRRSVLVALPVALAAGDQIKEMIPGTIDDRAIKFMQDNAPGIMGATLAATVLYPEAKASMLAIRHVAEKEGPLAARQIAKKLGPALGTYILGAIPAIIGMSLARKYMRQARSEKAEISGDIEQMMSELEKTSASLIEEFLHHGKDVAHVAKAIAKGTAGLISKPGTMRNIGRAAKEVGASPEFVHGAIVSAVPAALGALYMYSTPSGEIVRKRMSEAHKKDIFAHEKPGHSGGVQMVAKERWREQHPLRFAGLVALGAAMAGGIMTKFMRDLTPIL